MIIILLELVFTLYFTYHNIHFYIGLVLRGTPTDK